MGRSPSFVTSAMQARVEPPSAERRSTMSIVEPVVERIEASRFRIRAVEETEAIVALLDHGEAPPGRKAMQAERIGLAVDPHHPAARPADDRKQDGRDGVPEDRVRPPQDVAAGDRPDAKFGALPRHQRARLAVPKLDYAGLVRVFDRK